MIYTAKIEQTKDYQKRIKYLTASDSVIKKESDHLGYVRNVTQPYGWIMETGTPPCDHLDVIMMTDKEYKLGDEEKVKIIGVFYRVDGDHKLVAVCTDREIDDFSELTDVEKEDMYRLYPRVDKEKGEGWYGREKAEEVLAAYFAKKKQKTIITVRHAESEHHVNGMIGAWGDWNLTERGHAQAYKIGEWLKNEVQGKEFTMYTSDLKRAYQTAEEINKSLGFTPIVTDVIREVNAGAGNGTSQEWYNANKKVRPDYFDPDFKSFDDGESDRELWNRLYPFYQEIISNDKENIIIVSHGTTLYFLQMMLTRHSLNDLAKVRFSGKSGAVSKFSINKYGKVTVSYLNHNVE